MLTAQHEANRQSTSLWQSWKEAIDRRVHIRVTMYNEKVHDSLTYVYNVCKARLALIYELCVFTRRVRANLRRRRRQRLLGIIEEVRNESLRTETRGDHRATNLRTHFSLVDEYLFLTRERLTAWCLWKRKVVYQWPPCIMVTVLFFCILHLFYSCALIRCR